MENQIETKTDPELVLLLQNAHEQIRLNEQNIRIILNEANARLERHRAQEAELSKNDDENKPTA